MEAEIARYLYELGVLKRVRRSGWWLAGVRDPESVAEHSFRAAAIAYLLAAMEGADPAKALAMAIFHDTAEARVNDLHRLGRKYVDWSGVAEKVVLEQTQGLPQKLAENLRSLLGEAAGKATLEARIAKDADLLECLLQAREYEREGYHVEEWIKSSVEELMTASAKRLARAIVETPPGAWREAAGC